MQGRKGFTFMEIMVVLMILAGLAMISLPRMKGMFFAVRSKAAARDVTALLRYARDVAVLRELPCMITFAPQKDIYELVLLDENGEAAKKDHQWRRRRDKQQSFSIGEEARGPRRLPQDVHFAAIYTAAPLTEDDLPCVIYYPDGSATAATVAIQDDKENAVSVEIFQTTGMARVEKGLPVRNPPKQRLYYGPGS